MPVPEQAYDVRVAFLPPMSGLASNETRLDSGAIDVRMGEGRTAEVLRNLCYSLAPTPDNAPQWEDVVEQVRQLFRVELERPEYVQERGEVRMSYRDPRASAWISPAPAGACSKRCSCFPTWPFIRDRSCCSTSRTHISNCFGSARFTRSSPAPRAPAAVS